MINLRKLQKNVLVMNYRNLKEEEIKSLVANQCVADDWNSIMVVEDFLPLYIHNARFSGAIRLGVFKKDFVLGGGIKKHSGLFNVTLHNVEVGDDCLIENVKNYIANYKIGSGSFISNVDVILTDGPTSFGNGIDVATMSETGARAVRIYDELSSHLAYILALYRHRPELIAKANALIDNYVAEVRSDIGVISENTTIVNTGYIKNVKIGVYTKIEGCASLKNGSINSVKEAPIHIGIGVIAEDFIVSSGAAIEDGVILNRCFVGQACHLGHNYSATDSLFFSNCEGENGEACAIFAGPYTVTHHKSTLLIAGMFSFMNAGSGSNQSNHNYKLGPIHHGILERGSKTASDSYILWPAKVGVFSLVVGRHIHRLDTSSLPFSYLLESDNKSYLVPGANLKTVGTIRDAQKWPKRDKRKAAQKLDYINFNLLNPYTANEILKAISILENLKKSQCTEVYEYNGAHIKSSALNKGLELYRLALDKYFGKMMLSRLRNHNLSLNTIDDAQIYAILNPNSNIGEGLWQDLSGLIAPKTQVDAFLDKLESGLLTDISQSSVSFTAMHLNYPNYEWSWGYNKILEYYHLDSKSINKQDIKDIIIKWKEAVVSLDNQVYEDLKKDHELGKIIGCHIDNDFPLESTPFAQMLKSHSKTAIQIAEELSV